MEMHHRLASLQIGIQVLRYAIDVVLNDGVSHPQNRFRGAVILVEDNILGGEELDE